MTPPVVAIGLTATYLTVGLAPAFEPGRLRRMVAAAGRGRTCVLSIFFAATWPLCMWTVRREMAVTFGGRAAATRWLIGVGWAWAALVAVAWWAGW